MRALAIRLLSPGLLVLASAASAQAVAPAPPGAAAPRAAASASKAVVASGPGWNTLSAEQKEALMPLAGSWNAINEFQKRKWLALSQNFARMTPAEQATLHSRMKEWAALSPQQRSQARLNFGEARQLPADEKKAKWEAYQALSPEEKRKLVVAPAKPAGAAPALKPVPAQKLAQVPEAPPAVRKSAPGTAFPLQQVNPNTLLPRAPAAPAGKP